MDYDSFGNPCTSCSAVGSFGFEGGYTDNTGLIYLESRYYDPTTEQFISVDPDVANTDQPYAFTSDNPVNASDPSGMFFMGDGGQTAGVDSAGKTIDNHENTAIQRADDAPVTESAPSGHCSDWNPFCDAGQAVDAVANHADTVWRSSIDAIQDPAYLAYWGSYEAIGHLNSLASDCGPVSPLCSIATHLVTAPLVPVEGTFLGVDAFENILKGESIWQQGQSHEFLFGSQPGGPELSRWLANLTGSNVPVDMNFPGFRASHTVNFAW